MYEYALHQNEPKRNPILLIRRPNSWSQEKTAMKKQFASRKGPGFLTSEKRSMLLLAAKTTLAAGICYWLATLAHLQDGYWGSISAIIVMQSNVGSTVDASRDRLIGTLIGAIYGGLCSLLDPYFGMLWIYSLAVILAMTTCSVLGLKNSSRLAGVTVTILLLVHRGGSNWLLPAHRVLEVVLGIVVALTISALVFPSRARVRLRNGLAQEYLLLGGIFDAIVQGIAGLSPEHVGHLWRDVEAAILSNGRLLEEGRNEPSSGPMTVEGLSLLHQFGREILDVLKALGYAIKSSENSGYTEKLEPELGELITHIGMGFPYVGGCIHRWKFNEPPKGFVLEEDIARLETKMADIRATGLEFPQAEILRAYAIQLHMKQLARLLRSSRVETGKIV
jgi:hypothetical protein